MSYSVSLSNTISVVGTTPGSYQAECPSPAVSTGQGIINWMETYFNTAFHKAPTKVTLDFTQMTNQGVAVGIQSALIDNSECGFPVTLIDSVGNTYQCPAGSQAIFNAEFVKGAPFVIQPAISTLMFQGIFSSDIIYPGPQNQPVEQQTQVSFFNYRQQTKVWKVRPYPIGVQSPSGPGTLGTGTTVIDDSEITDCFQVQFFSPETWTLCNSNFFNGTQAGKFCIKEISAPVLNVLTSGGASINPGYAVDLIAGTGAFGPKKASISMAPLAWPPGTNNATVAGNWTGAIPFQGGRCGMAIGQIVEASSVVRCDLYAKLRLFGDAALPTGISYMQFNATGIILN
jgi:hypothetical protein